MLSKVGILCLLGQALSVALAQDGTCSSVDGSGLYADFGQNCGINEEICSVEAPDPSVPVVPTINLMFDPVTGSDEYNAITNACLAKNGTVCSLNSKVSIPAANANYAVTGFPMCVPDSCSEDDFLANYTHPICATGMGETCDVTESTMSCSDRAVVINSSDNCIEDRNALELQGWDADLMSNTYSPLMSNVMMSCQGLASGIPSATCSATMDPMETTVIGDFSKLTSSGAYASFDAQCTSSANKKCTSDAKSHVTMNMMGTMIAFSLDITNIPLCLSEGCTEEDGTSIMKSALLGLVEMAMFSGGMRRKLQQASLEEMCNAGEMYGVTCDVEFMNYSCVEIAEPVATPVAEPVAAPVAEPVAAPVPAPVAAPVEAPVAAIAPTEDEESASGDSSDEELESNALEDSKAFSNVSMIYTSILGLVIMALTSSF